MRFAIYFEGAVSQREVLDLFHAAGYSVRTDGAGRMVASRVPAFVKRDPVVLAAVQAVPVRKGLRRVR